MPLHIYVHTYSVYHTEDVLREIRSFPSTESIMILLLKLCLYTFSLTSYSLVTVYIGYPLSDPTLDVIRASEVTVDPDEMLWDVLTTVLVT